MLTSTPAPTEFPSSTTGSPGPTPTNNQGLKPTLTQLPINTPVWCPVQPVATSGNKKLRIAYANQGSLWLWEEGETVKQLVKPGDIQQISISDDGQIIVYTRQLDEHHVELWAINQDGSHDRRLLTADELTHLDGSADALGVLPTLLQWEPGSHRLSFFTYPLLDALWIFEPSIPWLVDLDTDKVNAAPYRGGHLAYAPNGKQLAIFSTDGFSLVSMDGKNLKENILLGYHGIGEGESYYHPWPFWANDSSSLLVALPDQDEMYTKGGTVTVWRVPVEGTPQSLGQWTAFAPSVQFSPDHTYMAYWPWPEGSANQRELHLARIERSPAGNALDSVVQRGELIDNLAWSPDSQHFVYQMSDSGQQAEFFYLGGICQPSDQLMDTAGGGTGTWVDDTRFLLEINLPNFTDQWELRLGRIDQGQTELLGVVKAYDWAIIP